MTDLFNQAGLITIVGIFITFTALFILVIIVNFLKWLDHKWEEREHHEEKEAYSKHQNVDDTTLVLISAAIATYFKGRAVIKRVRVLPNSARRGGTWATQARTVLQSSHVTKK